MTEEKKISEYLEVLSSKAPVPGGGGASALAGALGNALGQMVVNLTVGKKKYAEVEEEMQKYLTDLKNMQQEFLHFSDRDAEVFAPLAECYRLPSATPEEKEHKDAVMEEKLLDASMVPVEIMEKSLELLEILDVLADKGSRMPHQNIFFGASDRNRTNDTGIFSPLLYRLSYRGVGDLDGIRTHDLCRDRAAF